MLEGTGIYQHVLIHASISPFTSFLHSFILSHHAEYDSILGVAMLKDFWAGVRDDDPKLIMLLRETSFTRAELNEGKVVPLVVHGDKVEYGNNESLMVWHFAPLLSFKVCTAKSCLLMVIL